MLMRTWVRNRCEIFWGGGTRAWWGQHIAYYIWQFAHLSPLLNWKQFEGKDYPFYSPVCPHLEHPSCSINMSWMNERKESCDSKCWSFIRHRQGDGHWSRVANVAEMLLCWAVKPGKWLEVITANTSVDLLCSRHCAKCLSYVGIFVIQNQELNKSG